MPGVWKPRLVPREADGLPPVGAGEVLDVRHEIHAEGLVMANDS